MQSLASFLVFVFQLLVGPTATDAKQFSLLKGEWVVERAMADGVQLPAQEWKGKKVVFAGTESKTLANSAALDGRLRTKGNMAWIETKTVTMCSGDRTDQTLKADDEYSCSFEVKGKTMKLLMAKVTDPSHRGPRPIGESKGEGGILLFLRKG